MIVPLRRTLSFLKAMVRTLKHSKGIIWEFNTICFKDKREGSKLKCMDKNL